MSWPFIIYKEHLVKTEISRVKLNLTYHVRAFNETETHTHPQRISDAVKWWQFGATEVWFRLEATSFFRAVWYLKISGNILLLSTVSPLSLRINFIYLITFYRLIPSMTEQTKYVSQLLSVLRGDITAWYIWKYSTNHFIYLFMKCWNKEAYVEIDENYFPSTLYLWTELCLWPRVSLVIIHRRRRSFVGEIPKKKKMDGATYFGGTPQEQAYAEALSGWLVLCALAKGTPSSECEINHIPHFGRNR